MLSRTSFKLLIIASALCTTLAQVATAAPVGGLARGLKTAPPSQFIVAKRPTLAPFAFVKFCRENRSDCEARSGSTIVNMNSARRAQLRAINISVNAAISPENDDAENGDVWQIGAASGDCEDYALTKRRELINAGWPVRALRMAVAKTSSGEGHAVLVVKTTDGDLVLDNRTSQIRPWNRAGLRWEKIQSSENPRMWQDI